MVVATEAGTRVHEGGHVRAQEQLVGDLGEAVDDPSAAERFDEPPRAGDVGEHGDIHVLRGARHAVGGDGLRAEELPAEPEPGRFLA